MAVIEVEQVSKLYLLGASRTSLREAITHSVRRLVQPQIASNDHQEFWALRDVSFAVQPGEVLGIIGHNGAGKSTMLKLLSRVTYPSHGRIRTRGRMAALIELGAGFHPDLTGRENIYLNGSILGIKQREIDAQFDSMVEFAGLERFIDTPVKRYSSGMYVRLAFAVASHVRADLLLVDEVLSVGDMAFQQKSMAKMNQLREDGATIVFISHNLAAVQSFCSRAILLQRGQIAAEGSPAEVIKAYKVAEQEKRREELLRRAAEQNEPPAPRAARQGGLSAGLLEIDLLDEAGTRRNEFDSWQSVTMRCRYELDHSLASPILMVRIRRRRDGLICFSQYTKAPGVTSLDGSGQYEARLAQLTLVAGLYLLETQMYSEFSAEEPTSTSIPFEVTGRLRDEDAGVFEPRIEWSLSEAEPAEVKAL